MKSDKKLNPKSRRFSPSDKRKILEHVRKGLSYSEASKIYSVHPSTIRRWFLYECPLEKESDIETDNQSIPHHNGYHKNWEAVLSTWKKYPGLGPAQIKNQLTRDGIKISIATVRNILLENGYTPPKTKFKTERCLRYEAARPREIIHFDFKHFYINKKKVFLLLLQDDYSRFICGHKMTDSENIDAVIEAFEECVARHGKMQTIMTDAGSAFYAWNGINRFQKLVGDEYGIDHIKAGSPRSNGKLESVNKQIEKELLTQKNFSSLTDAEEGISEWILFYNFERTHMGLSSGEVPADRFYYQWNSILPKRAKKQENNLWEDLIRTAVKKIA